MPNLPTQSFGHLVTTDEYNDIIGDLNAATAGLAALNAQDVVTLTPASGTTSRINFCGIDFDGGAVEDGDVIIVVAATKERNNTGGDETVVFGFQAGGGSHAAFPNHTWPTASPSEIKTSRVYTFIRVGTELWGFQAVFGALSLGGVSYKPAAVVSSPTFASDWTLQLTVQFATPSVDLYLTPMQASVLRMKNGV